MPQTHLLLEPPILGGIDLGEGRLHRQGSRSIYLICCICILGFCIAPVIASMHGLRLVELEGAIPRYSSEAAAADRRSPLSSRHVEVERVLLLSSSIRRLVVHIQAHQQSYDMDADPLYHIKQLFYQGEHQHW